MCLNLYLPRIEEHYKYAEIMPKHNISPSTRFFPHKERYEIFDGKIFARKSCRKIEDFCTRFCSHKNRPYLVRLPYRTSYTSNVCKATRIPYIFPSFFLPLPFSLFMESTSYVFPFRMVFFYLVTTCWIFYISLCENSTNQSIVTGTCSTLSNRILNIFASFEHLQFFFLG